MRVLSRKVLLEIVQSLLIGRALNLNLAKAVTEKCLSLLFADKTIYIYFLYRVRDTCSFELNLLQSFAKTWKAEELASIHTRFSCVVVSQEARKESLLKLQIFVRVLFRLICIEN